MSDIISAIYDDMEEYKYLCEFFNEEVQYSPDAYGNMLIDCYSDHAYTLKKRKAEFNRK